MSAGKIGAFSLIEVLLALGIVAFALIAVVGLLSVGLKTNKESSDQIQASNVASLLMATIRALPTNPPVGFGLPNLNQGFPVTGTNGVTYNGMGTNAADAAYGLYYMIGTNSSTGAKIANVYLMLWRPAGTPIPTNSPGAYYELTSQVALP